VRVDEALLLCRITLCYLHSVCVCVCVCVSEVQEQYGGQRDDKEWKKKQRGLSMVGNTI
jgi:hypothetical protein